MADAPVLGIRATALDHVGIAVVDLGAAIDRYRAVFGGEPVHRETMESDGVDEALFAVGGSFVQLLAPTAQDTPVGRFLDRRGEGIHHVGYRVPDVAAALDHLRALGMELADRHPRRGSRGTTVAFAHPRSFGGVLVELVQEEREGTGT